MNKKTTLVQNPIIRGFNPDPSICRVGDDYYIATSTFEWYPGVQIHHSRDLVNWTLVSRPLNRADLLDMTGCPDSCGVWAPCITWSDGLFYLIYTNTRRFDGDFKDSPNYLTTCDRIDGQWSERVYLNSSGFDPSLFHDEDGKKYLVNMVWDYRPGKNYFGGILLQEYSVVEKRLVGPVHNIFRGTPLGLTEGPHLYKVGEYYYLLVAEGGTSYEHAMVFARSKKIEGPYEVDPDGAFITSVDAPENKIQRTGHGGLIQTPEGEWYTTHLCSRPLDTVGGKTRRSPMGRETGLQKLVLNEQGWFRLACGGYTPEHNVPVPGAVALVSTEGKRLYTFKEPTLDDAFQWLRSADTRFMSLTQRRGFLRLFGQESLGSWYQSSLVAVRQEHFQFEVVTEMEFDPSEFLQMAGLVCYYNAHKYHYLYMSRDDDGQIILNIMSCEGRPDQFSSFPLGEGIAVQSNRLFLRASVNLDELQFSFSLNQQDWQNVGDILDYSLISDEAGKGEGANFTGAFVGVCCQDLSGNRNPADFAFFSYEGK